MASQGKRMVNENLIKYLKEMDKEGISIADLADMLSNYDASSDVFDGDTLMENVIDQDGNNRFVEGDGTVVDTESVTYTYHKWSLSGSHLMIVVAGNVANGTVLTNVDMVTFNIPSYILNKLSLITTNIVDYKTVPMYSSTLTSQNFPIQLRKTTTGLYISRYNLTLNDDRTFRIQFDLLVDND